MSKEADEEELARIEDELLQRLRRGEKVDWPTWVKRHPHHAEELKRLAPVMEAVVKVLLEEKRED